MNRSIPSKFLAFALALVMVFSMLPVSVFAEETVTFTKITTLEELTTGTYVLVTEKGYAPSDSAQQTALPVLPYCRS